MKGKISEVYRRKFNQVLFSIEKLPKDSSVNKIKRPYSFIRIRSMRMEGLEPSRCLQPGIFVLLYVAIAAYF